MPAPQPSETRDRILDIAQDLLQSRGFHAFSYQDIAEALGIKKASIHYHFPSKADLGAALSERHAARTRDYLDAVTAAGRPVADQLDAFFKPFVHIASSANCMCAGGMVAAEFPTLDLAMQRPMQSFFKSLHTWLVRLLERGRAENVFTFAGSPAVRADTVIASLEGMILLALVRKDGSFVKAMIKDIKSSLGC